MEMIGKFQIGTRNRIVLSFCENFLNIFTKQSTSWSRLEPKKLSTAKSGQASVHQPL